MPAPTSYTEEEFATYLHQSLGHTAEALGWSTAGNDYDLIVEETLLAMGVSDIDEVTDIRQIRALGQLHLWQAVANAVAGDYDFSADGASYSRSQLIQHAQQRLESARTAAMEWDPAYSAVVGEVTYHRDPYADHDDALSDGIDQYIEERKAAS